MKNDTKNLITVVRRWKHSLGFSLNAGLTAVLFALVMMSVMFMGGCGDETQGIVNVCITPTVTRTTPPNGGTNEPLNKVGKRTGPAKIAAVKIISATFSTPMDPRSISSATFIVQQGATSISGTVSYSDTTAFFMVPNGLGSNLSYTCTITTGARDVAGIALANNYVWSFTTSSPSTPTLVSPVNLAVNQVMNPMMVWNVVPGADTYRLQISLSPVFIGTVYDDSTQTSTSQQISGLSVGTTYYWRVNSKVSGGTSGYSTEWSFTTIAPPAPPVLASPIAGAVNVSTSPTLSWNASVSASTYRLQISTSNTFATTVFDDSTNTGISQPISGLTIGTTYYWRVNAKNAAGTSAYSTTWTFTSIAAGTPILVSPLNGATNQPVNPTLIWNTVPGADTYRLQVSLSPVFITTLYDDSTRTNTSQQLTGLNVGTTYYWRVNSKISGGTSSYSTQWSFTTIAPPATPVLVAPLSAAVNLPTNPTLSWLPSTGTNTYRLQVSTSNTFATTVYNDSTNAGTSQPLSGLTVATTYYWRVNAKNVAGTSAYSTAWNFTTIAPPAPPVLVAPVAGAVNISTTPTLTWLASPGANTYRLQISTSNTFATTVFNDSTNTGISQPISGLTLGTTYYWRVNAKNAAGTSAYSSRSFTTTFSSLQPPILVAPLDAAVNVSTSPTLSWLTSTGATTYRLQVDTSSLFASTVYDDSTLAGLSHLMAGLTHGQTYYWRVNAKNSSGTSDYSLTRRFTTITTPPGAPTLVAPANAAIDQFTNPTMIWNDVQGADTYRLQVSLTSGFASTVYNDSTRTNASQQLSGLAVGTTYYWRVNAKNIAGTSAYSTVWSFTTIGPPAPPVLVAPVNAAVNQFTNPTMIWNEVPGADTYRLQVSLSPGFVSTVYNDSTRTSTSQQISGLTVGTTYYWRVNAKNIAGTGSYSTVWNFTTIGPPAPPVLVAPIAAAQNQPTTLTLSWLTSIGADTYRLQVSTNIGFTSTVFNDSTITGTSQPITGLIVGTTYYWRVNAKNIAGTSAYSTRSFTTIVAGLQAPILVAPADAASNISTSPTLSWNASTGAATYRLQVDTSSVFASTVYDDSTLVGLSHPMAGLTNGQTYYWRVNAKNSGGTSAYSTTWRFTIVAVPPPTIVLGVAARFGSFGGSAGVTNQGINSQVNGDIGTTGASTLITGFHDATAPPSNVFTETPLNIGAVSDTIYTATAPPGSVAGAVATQALADAQTAFDTLKALPPGPDPGAGELGGLVLAPGTYTSAGGTFKITSLDLTLDAQNDPNARFVFQMASSLTVGAAGPAGARSVILINGAQPKNVFWVVGTGGSGAATINGAGGGTMVGTIIAYSGVTFSTHDNVTITTLNGRALGLNASVTMVNTVINVPLP